MLVPSYDRLFQPTLDAMRSLTKPCSVDEIEQRVVELMKLPAEVVNEPATGQKNMTALQYRLHWARTYLKRVGLITNPHRGTWDLTEQDGPALK